MAFLFVALPRLSGTIIVNEGIAFVLLKGKGTGCDGLDGVRTEFMQLYFLLAEFSHFSPG